MKTRQSQRILIAITAIVALLTSLPAVRAHAGTGSPLCADVIYLAARGSGQAPQGSTPYGQAPFGNGEGPELQSLGDLLASHVAHVHRTFSSAAVQYPADGVEDFLPSNAELAMLPHLSQIENDYYLNHISPYFNSLAAGRDATVAATEHWAGQCPDSQLVLAGYSQGAMAVHRAELWMRNNNPALLTHVATTLLLGDGDRTKNSSAQLFGTSVVSGRGVWNAGAGAGVLQSSVPDVPEPSTTAEICNAHDIICDVNWTYLLGSLSVPGILLAFKHADSVHTHYVHHSDTSVTWTDPALADAATWAGEILDKPAAEITTATLPVASIGSAYKVQLTALRGLAPYAWRVSGGALPKGVALTSAGILSGTPQTAGTYAFWTTVTTKTGIATSALLHLTVQAAPTAGTVNVLGSTSGPAGFYSFAQISPCPRLTDGAQQGIIGLLDGRVVEAMTSGAATVGSAASISMQVFSQTSDPVGQESFTFACVRTLTGSDISTWPRTQTYPSVQLTVTGPGMQLGLPASTPVSRGTTLTISDGGGCPAAADRTAALELALYKTGSPGVGLIPLPEVSTPIDSAGRWGPLHVIVPTSAPIGDTLQINGICGRDQGGIAYAGIGLYQVVS